jgi:hypothetical protein
MFLICSVLFCLIGTSTDAYCEVTENYRYWISDSYDFGRTGNDCSDIYFDYGTQEWTVNAEDPQLLEQLYNACKIGKDDRSTGKNRLLQIIDAWETTH